MTAINSFLHLNGEDKHLAMLKHGKGLCFDFICSSGMSRKRKDCVSRCSDY